VVFEKVIYGYDVFEGNQSIALFFYVFFMSTFLYVIK